MTVTADDLRIELDEPSVQWTVDDQERADDILGRCLARIVAHIGGAAYNAAVEAEDQVALDLVDEINVAYAARRFPNPEQALQRRSGADNSVSFADGSEAASGLTAAEKAALSDAFAGHGPGRFVPAWNASEVRTLRTPRRDLG